MNTTARPLRITMMGIRSFPGTQGGVETHAENLCPLLVNLGCEVEVLARSTYHHSHLLEWKGVRFKRLYAPPFKRLETVVHSFISVMYAGLINRPDVLHIQAIGPALMTPLARLMGLKVVVTHHGPDYDRQKWGRFAKLTLQTGERLGMRWSNARIVISQVIKNIVLLNHDRDSHVIPNGVVLPEAPSSTAVLNKFGLNPFRYILLVSRLVPEKRHLDLIEAFNRAVLPGWKLAIVGSADHPGTYAQQVLDAAKQSPNIVCTGLQTGNALRELYGHAGIFVLPSSHEGLPIALLEALSYGLPVIASDIPANLEIGLAKEHYFPLGRTDVLTERLGEFSAQPRSKEACDQRRAWVSARYDWNDIAIRTLAVYKALAQ